MVTIIFSLPNLHNNLHIAHKYRFDNYQKRKKENKKTRMELGGEDMVEVGALGKGVGVRGRACAQCTNWHHGEEGRTRGR